MILSGIKIENFKNYEKTDIVFSKGINCLSGPNGAGKTNILDAIYYLCTGKSYFNAIDMQLIFGNADYFSLRGEFEMDGTQETILCVVVKGRKKVIKRNEEAYERLIDHYGQFPVILVAPADLELVTGGSEDRRKWLDSAIAWVDKAYLISLLKYEKILQQRNAVLRKMEHENEHSALQLIRTYNEMMVPIANEIHEARKKFMQDFQPYFTDHHAEIAENKESVLLKYESTMLAEPIEKLLEDSIKKDMILQRTNVGPHRDDLEFLIEEKPLKKFGSQGQQKTFLLALKLAQHQYLKSEKGFAPILMLDDVSERLDGHRLASLFRLIQNPDKFGQVFVTDTDAHRVNGYMNGGGNIETYKVENGNVYQD